MSCLVVKGTKHMLWLMWLWASVTWEGCGVPWARHNKVSTLCGHSHIAIAPNILQKVETSLPSAVGTLMGRPMGKMA